MFNVNVTDAQWCLDFQDAQVCHRCNTGSLAPKFEKKLKKKKLAQSQYTWHAELYCSGSNANLFGISLPGLPDSKDFTSTMHQKKRV